MFGLFEDKKKKNDVIIEMDTYTWNLYLRKKDELSKYAIDSPEYKVCDDECKFLYDKAIQLRGQNIDSKDRKTKNITSIALGVAGIGVSTCLALASFAFDNDGKMFTSSFGKKLVDHVIFWKK